MPRISTDNYDTVASWNGSQDLFVVEQPDGTKVATPAMVKQFIEAGDFEATGEVKDGHGNKLADVVAEIGDLSQTGLTGDSVAEQLGSAKTYVDNAVAKTSITPTLNSGFAMDNGSITISNKVCYFAPNFYYNSNFTVGTAVDVGTLPSNCKPKTGIRIAALSGTAELLGVIMIDTGGGIKYYPAHISRYFGYVQACFEVK